MVVVLLDERLAEVSQGWFPVLSSGDATRILSLAATDGSATVEHRHIRTFDTAATWTQRLGSAMPSPTTLLRLGE